MIRVIADVPTPCKRLRRDWRCESYLGTIENHRHMAGRVEGRRTFDLNRRGENLPSWRNSANRNKSIARDAHFKGSRWLVQSNTQFVGNPTLGEMDLRVCSQDERGEPYMISPCLVSSAQIRLGLSCCVERSSIRNVRPYTSVVEATSLPSSVIRLSPSTSTARSPFIRSNSAISLDNVKSTSLEAVSIDTIADGRGRRSTVPVKSRIIVTRPIAHLCRRVFLTTSPDSDASCCSTLIAPETYSIRAPITSMAAGSTGHSRPSLSIRLCRSRSKSPTDTTAPLAG